MTPQDYGAISIKDLPGPKGGILFGAIPAIKGRQQDRHNLYAEWADQFSKGNTTGCYAVPLFMGKKMLVVHDLGMINKILDLRKNPQLFIRPKMDNIEELAGESVFSTTDITKREPQRKAVMMAMNQVQVGAFMPTMRDIAGKYLEEWSTTITNGNQPVLINEFKKYAFDVITQFALGSQAHDSKSGAILADIHQVFTTAGNRLTSPVAYWRWPGFSTLPENRSVKRAVERIENYVQVIINETRINMNGDSNLTKKGPNLIQAMLAWNADPKNQADIISDAQISGNARVAILAGDDTTSSGLASIIHNLAKYPELQDKIRDEVHNIPFEQFSIDTLSQFPVLQAFIGATLENSPPAPAITLQAVRDTIINDILIQKGDLITCLTRVALGGAKDKPLDQEKIVNDARALPKNSLVFGKSHFFCPGAGLAKANMAMLTAGIVQKFNIELNPFQQVNEVMTITMGLDNLPIIFNLIQSN